VIFLSKSRYGELGVDVNKRGIEAFRDLTKGLYRHAFCEIHQEPDMPGYGFVHHTDGAGSKPVQNYLNWKVTGDINCFKGIAQDVLAMNIGDAFCVGIPTSGSFVDYAAINKFRVPKEYVLKIFAEEWTGLFEMLKEYGIAIRHAGGETADLPDQIRTLDVSGTIHARYKLGSVITGEEIRLGDKIIGLESGGQARYEKSPAGPIMCNGLTLARHCLMKPEFGDKYPEIKETGNEYTGQYSPLDQQGNLGVTIGEELTKPTRIFAPVFKYAVNVFRKGIHGVVFNTGGGHTKCLRVGKGIKYIKDNLPTQPGIFRLIQQYGNVPWKEMYVDFNMGVGAELYVDKSLSEDIIEFMRVHFNINAWEIGHCSRAVGDNKVRLETRFGNYEYGPKKRK